MLTHLRVLALATEAGAVAGAQKLLNLALTPPLHPQSHPIANALTTEMKKTPRSDSIALSAKADGSVLRSEQRERAARQGTDS